ncbi:interferon-induced GTP-binding protein Mx2 [Orycteropus afer afer]|uniref:Interferon-induced GTP-binding protein Mx2 n=1 Tax=Orycteropus afer afer TaxID=1230840 RepID=A0A8B7AC10_ORYAF|nr:interferon-induced GTP-binding protein Mx2 [Orycteropus afer afer]
MARYSHKSWPYRKQNPLSSQHHLKKEMNFLQQHPQPSFGTEPKQKIFPQNQQGDLTVLFTSMELNQQFASMQLGENKSQPKAKAVKSCLSSQYEEKVRPYIDLIDSLRALGVEQDLALPAIAVIGDQNSGKSSVLEALTGVSLPRGNGIVTRCPLVLKLKTCKNGWRGKISYQNMEFQLRDPTKVEQAIYEAQNAIAGHGVGISQELINLEITSLEVPDLTLIDLPGITRMAVGNQPLDIGLQIKSLIKKYIQRQQTINLVVVPCNVDIATTEALTMAKEVDPDGDRTIGILTKPDLVDKGDEKSVLNMVQNLTYYLKKGYMIVRCRDQQEIMDNLNLAEATKREINFFQRHPNFRVLLEEGKASVPCLAGRLTTELIMHIKKSLPLLENQIKDSHKRATEELRQCGTDIPSEETDKMFFLIEKIKMFNRDIEKLIEGEEAVKENETRLYNKIRKEFKTWELVLAANTQKVKNIIHEEVSNYDKQYRGRELPGFINHKTFENIVQRYIQQLIDPALDMLQNVIEIVQQAFIHTAKNNFGEFPNLNQTAQNMIKDIKLRHAETAENLTQLQFRMEQLVFCQDQIYSMVLKRAQEEVFNSLENPPQCFQTKKANIFDTNVRDSPTPSTSSISEMGMHLNAYFMETSTRLANQIPLLIQFFVLQENGDCLQRSMMQVLQEKDHYAWLLQEHRERAAKRRFLKERIYGLMQAQRTLNHFST